MNNLSFESYQNGQILGFSQKMKSNSGKSPFKSFFDNENADFQKWRDEQIRQLQTDNLTERRLRMAIWQKLN